MDRALKLGEEILAHFWWVHCSHVSHRMAAWPFLQGLEHSVHGYLKVRGPGLVSRSPDRIRREHSQEDVVVELIRRRAKLPLER